MSAGTPLNGNAMTVKKSGATVDHSCKWQISGTAAKGRYSSNSTGGGRKTSIGVKDWSGSVEVYLHDGGSMPFLMGTEYTMVFHGSATADTVSGTIIITGVGNIMLDADSGEPVVANYDFDFQGIPTGAGAFTLS